MTEVEQIVRVLRAQYMDADPEDIAAAIYAEVVKPLVEDRDEANRVCKDAVEALAEIEDSERALEEERDRLRGAIESARGFASRAPELNMSNYDNNDVASLNDAMIEIYLLVWDASPARTALSQEPQQGLVERNVGYVDAFYEVAKILGIGATARPPKEIWEAEMKPLLESLVRRNNPTAGASK